VKKNRPRDKTPGAPEDMGNTSGRHGYGVVAANQNVTIVNEKSISDSHKSDDGFIVVYAYGFIRLIGTGHNEGRKLIFHNQVMQRGIRKHDTQVGRTGGDLGSDARFLTFADEDDRSLWRRQKFFFRIVDFCKGFDLLDIPDHNAKRFLFPVFPGTESTDGYAIRRIDGQMKTAQSFQRQDLSCLEKSNSLRYGINIGNDSPLSIQKSDHRSAGRTSVRFGVKAAVCRILVFGGAFGTKWKGSHGGYESGRKGYH
jgi:hypothetical protein